MVYPRSRRPGNHLCLAPVLPHVGARYHSLGRALQQRVTIGRRMLHSIHKRQPGALSGDDSSRVLLPRLPHVHALSASDSSDQTQAKVQAYSRFR